MNEIIEMLINLKIDKPMYITDGIIKQYIEDNIELLVKEISQEVN